VNTETFLSCFIVCIAFINAELVFVFYISWRVYPY